MEQVYAEHHVQVCRWDFYQKPSAADCLSTFITRCGETIAPRPSEQALARAAASWMLRGCGAQRNLLLLEGFEELMKGRNEEGQVIEAPLMRDFLHEVAGSRQPKTSHSGLVLITSRERLLELQTFGRGFRELALKPLTQSEGEELLQRLLVPGATTAPERLDKKAARVFVRAVHGHPLTITLAAGTLRASGVQTFDLGEIARLIGGEEMPVSSPTLSRSGQHCLPAYVLRHAVESLTAAERQFMQLVGGAIWPVTDNLVQELILHPAATHAADRASGSDLGCLGLATIKRQLVPRLERRLLLTRSPDGYTAHPLVKAFFSADLEKEPPFREAVHLVCFNYICKELGLLSEVLAVEHLSRRGQGAYHACRCGQAREGFKRLGYGRLAPHLVGADGVVQQAPSSVLAMLRPYFSDDSWSNLATQPSGSQLGPVERLQLAITAARCWQQVGSYGSALADNCWRLCSTELESLEREHAQGLTTHSGVWDEIAKGTGSQTNQPASLSLSELGRPLKAYIGLNLWRSHLLRGRLQCSLDQAKQISLLLRDSNPQLSEAAQVLVCGSLFFMGQFGDALVAASGAEQVATADAVRECEFFQGDTNDPLAATLCYKALCQWHTASPDDARATISHAMERARKVQRPFALAVTLFFAGVLHYLLRHAPTVRSVGDELRGIGRRNGYMLWEAAGNMFFGWSEGGKDGLAIMQLGLDEWKATEVKLSQPLWLGMAAEIRAGLNDLDGACRDIGAALRSACEAGEHWQSVSLRLSHADFLLRARASRRDAVSEMEYALKLARAQQAPTLVAQAKESLRRLGRGKRPADFT